MHTVQLLARHLWSEANITVCALYCAFSSSTYPFTNTIFECSHHPGRLLFPLLEFSWLSYSLWMSSDSSCILCPISFLFSVCLCTVWPLQFLSAFKNLISCVRLFNSIAGYTSVVKGPSSFLRNVQL